MFLFFSFKHLLFLINVPFFFFFLSFKHLEVIKSKQNLGQKTYYKKLDNNIKFEVVHNIRQDKIIRVGLVAR